MTLGYPRNGVFWELKGQGHMVNKCIFTLQVLHRHSLGGVTSRHSLGGVTSRHSLGGVTSRPWLHRGIFCLCLMTFD